MIAYTLITSILASLYNSFPHKDKSDAAHSRRPVHQPRDSRGMERLHHGQDLPRQASAHHGRQQCAPRELRRQGSGERHRNRGRPADRCGADGRVRSHGDHVRQK